jgi:hypothetical protein
LNILGTGIRQVSSENGKDNKERQKNRKIRLTDVFPHDMKILKKRSINKIGTGTGSRRSSEAKGGDRCGNEERQGNREQEIS